MAAPMNADLCAKELAKSFVAQTEVCSRILEKSKVQQQLVEEHLENELLSLLGDKQKLIEEHQKLVDNAIPFRTAWEGGMREQATPAAHAIVEKAWNGLREVMDQIVKLEDASRAMLEDQKSRLSVNIGSLQRGKIVNKAYGGAAAYRPPPTPRYSDKKG